MWVKFRPHLGLLVLLLINLIAGVLVVRDYGESWDEHLRIRYAERSLAAYQGSKSAPLDEKGPFYVMLAYLGSQALVRLAPGWSEITAWHFMSFLSFLMSLAFFYVLCLRWLDVPAALAATLLFNTQPLLWGHAFINPKDIPFMAFFLGSITLGLHMADHLPVSNAPIVDTGGFVNSRRKLRRQTALALALASLLLVSLLFLLVVFRSTVLSALAGWLQAVYDSPAGPLRTLADWLMPNRAIPLQAYQDKLARQYPRLVGLYAGIALLLHLLGAAWLNPQAARRLWRARFLPWLAAFGRAFQRSELLAAGLFLGFSASIRVLGPFSGLLVSAYALQRAGRKALPGLAAYLALGFLVTYAAWPGLWEAPVRNYLVSFSQASDFPWDGKVTFAGQEYAVGELPRAYLPTLLALQFTEPALLVFLLGAALLLGRFLFDSRSGKRPGHFRAPDAILLAWLVLPVGAAVLLRSTVYDNFRQFLFTLPPIFVLAGLGIQLVLRRLRSLPLQAVLWTALLLPGLCGLVQLHPYQYTYYNRLAGGVSGAFRRYELDYWATSYQEAALYLNAAAPAGARVVVWGADHLVQSLARADLEIVEYRKVRDQEASQFEYAVLLTRHDKDLSVYPQSPVVLSIARSGAVFTVVKKLPGERHSP